MKKLLLSILTLCCAVAAGAQTDVKFDFDNNATALFGIEGRSSNDSSDGDITEAVTATLDGVKLTVSAMAEGAKTPNRLWATSPTLRMYSGTMTIDAGSHKITGIKVTQGKWNASNEFDSGTFANNVWSPSGDASKVVLTIAGNTQLKDMTVSLDGAEPEPEPEPEPTPEIDPSTLPGSGLGTQASPFDVTRAIAFCEKVGETATEKDYYVSGTVSKLHEKYANTFWMSADGTEGAEIEFYNGTGLQGSVLVAGDVKVGDKIVAFGKLVNYKGNTPELNTGCQIYSINGKIDKDPIETEGDGSEAKPYTVADIKGMGKTTSDGNSYWVKGFIIGNASSATALAEGDKITDTNIALAASASDTEFIPVAIPAGDLRAVLGVATNPNNVGREVMVYGTLEKYFSVAGVKSVSDYKWLGDEPEPQPGEEEQIFAIDFREYVDLTLLWNEGWEFYTTDTGTEDPETGDYGEADNILLKSDDGLVFDGSAYAELTCAMVYTPFFDISEYTGVYAQWAEKCKNFYSDEYINGLDASIAFCIYYDEEGNDGGEIGYEGARAKNNGDWATCKFAIADDVEGLRDLTFFYFLYYSSPADPDKGLEEDKGYWAVKNFELYGVKKGGSAVERIEPIPAEELQIFDVQGRKQASLKKGLNIVNGRKVFIK